MLGFDVLNNGVLFGLLGALLGLLAGLISVIMVVHKASSLAKSDFVVFRKKIIVYTLKNFLLFIGMTLLFLILITLSNSALPVTYRSQYLNAILTIIFIGLVFFFSNRVNKKIEKELSLLMT